MWITIVDNFISSVKSMVSRKKCVVDNSNNNVENYVEKMWITKSNMWITIVDNFHVIKKYAVICIIEFSVITAFLYFYFWKGWF